MLNKKDKKLFIKIITCIVAGMTMISLSGINFALGATFNWEQASWAGGATSTAATHPTNLTNWTYYTNSPAKDANFSAGANLTLSTITSSTTQTTDTDFNLGTTSQTQVSSNSVLLSQQAADLGVKKITGGNSHTCALRTNGSVICWGSNSNGQIGDNTTTQRNVPTQVSGLTAGTVKEIVAGDSHTCALKTDGSMVCWGKNQFGSIGDNTTIAKYIPTQVSGLTAGTVKGITGGGNHTCALKTDGSMVCWGNNGAGQIGDNTTTDRWVPTAVSGLTAGTVKEITTGNSHTCALKTNGSMVCWGWNNFGQIGDNTTTQRNVPTQVSGLTAGTVKEITGGDVHTCALKTDGSMVCWGNNPLGQIGDNTSGTDRLIPTQVSGLTAGTVKEITGGVAHTCALKTDGSMVCWGNNGAGQIGDNTTTDRWVPTAVSGLTAGTVKEITGGGDYSSSRGHTCALKTDGSVYCWGYNSNGQIGDNTTTQRLVPTQVSGLTTPTVGTVKEVAAGYFHTCALKTNGSMVCWGDNTYGEIGDNTTTQRNVPTQVSGLTAGTVKEITGGNYNTCALKTDGSVMCWGRNANGEIGDNSTTQRNIPTQVSGLTAGTVKEIAGGGTHTCALKTDGSMVCWGANNVGQIGDNTTTQRLVPTQVSDLTAGTVKEVVAGFRHTCALKTDGSMVCWGANSYGQIGDNSTTQRNVPTQVSGLTAGTVKEIMAGGYNSLFGHTCALKTDGSMVCWGYNISGQIGDNTTTQRNIPTAVSGLTAGTVNEITAGRNHTCALKTDGSMVCWGNNAYGGIGDNSTTQRNIPTQVSGLTAGTVKEVTAGGGWGGSEDHTCALKTDGSMACWGLNSSGQIGDNTTTNRWVPTQVFGLTPNPLYFSSGTFTSGIINIGYSVPGWNNLSWTKTGTGTITMKARSCSVSNCSGATDWTSCSSITSGQALSTGGCVTNGHQYIQYQASLSTADTTVTPSLDDVTVSYNIYPITSQFLTSSKYNTTSDGNVIGGISWDEVSKPAGTTISLYLRASSTEAGLDSAPWSSAITTSTIGCTKAGTLVSCTAEAIPAGLKDGVNDQWMQYRVEFLGSTGQYAPILDNVFTTYVVNATPDFQNTIVASQIATSTDVRWGKVQVQYSIRDEDGDGGSNTPYYVTPSFSYNSGSGWTDIATSSIEFGAPPSGGEIITNSASSSNGLLNKIATSSYLTYIAYATLPAGLSTNSGQIRVTINDNEGANNTASSTLSGVILDTTAPTGGGIVFDAGVAGGTNSATINITKATDLSGIQYYIADDALTHSTPANTGWVNISTATTSINWTFDSDIEAKTLKYQFRDIYGNTTATTTVSTQVPIPSSSFLVQDTSNINVVPAYYDMYIGWQAASSSGFSSYKLEYATSTDNTTFGNYNSISDASLSTVSTNYYMHRNLNTDLFYRYRVGIVGTNGNTSVRSIAYITAKPDGVQNYGEGGGGSVATASKVENVVATQGSDKNVTVNYLLTDSSLNKKTNPSYEGYLFYNIGVALPANAYNSGNNTLAVSDASKLQPSGYIQVNNEVLRYASKAGNVLSGLTRGTWPTNISSGRTTRQNTAFFEGAPVWAMATSTMPISITNSTIITGQTGSVVWDTSYETALAGSSYSNVGIRVLIHDNQDAGSGPLSSQNDYSETGILGALDMSPPTISFATSTGSGLESVATSTVIINLSKPYALAVSSSIATSGTAVYGVNYTLSESSISIPARATSTSVGINVTQDSVSAGDLTAILTLSGISNATAGANTAHTYTIIEDDVPEIGFRALSSSGYLSQTTSTNIAIDMSATRGRDVTIDYSISASSTAVAGIDYTTPETNTIKIVAGETIGYINIGLIATSTSGENKTLVLQISNPTNATLNASTTHTYTIINDNNQSPNFDPDYTPVAAQTSSEDPNSADSNLGKVSVQFKFKDADASQHLSPGTANYVTPSFEYNVGGGWTAVSTDYLTIYDEGGSPVSNTSLYASGISYLKYTAIWNAAGQIAGTASTSAQVKITLDDLQALNNSTSTQAPAFSLDTKAPVISSFNVDASSNGLTMVLTDDNNIFYRMSNNADLSADGLNASSSIWQTVGANSLNATSTWTFDNSATPTAYLQAKDILGNMTSSTARVLPAPTGLSFKDVSVPARGDYKEYLYWSAYTMPEGTTFSKYEVHRSTDGVTYVLLGNVTNINAPYYTDSSLSSGTTYYYKVRVVDTSGNGSLYSSEISDEPDGIGGTTSVAPTISSVAVASVGNDWAKITWTTDIVSNSVVEYSADSPSYTSSSTDTNYLIGHEITLTDLTPGTTYYYRVKSTDTTANTATSDGATFTTLSGPTISFVQAIPGDKSAVITWQTDVDSNSYVVYSTAADMASYSEVGNAAYVANGSTSTPFVHKVSLSGLNTGTTYYYYVKSTGDGGTTTETNRDAYYSFRTLYDTTPPVISSIATPVITSDTLVITWRTDEPATTQVSYGSQSGGDTQAYAYNTELDTALTTFHTATIKGLSAETTYYYILRAADESGNATTSVEQSAKTTKAGTVIVTAGGSAPAPTTTKDTTPPAISNISVDPINAFDATISFATNEDTLGFVEYGRDTKYGSIAGSINYGLSHSLILRGLIMGTDYHFRIKAIDASKNATFSEDKVFKTKYFAEQMESLQTVENAEQFQDQIEQSIQSILPSIMPPFLSEPEIYDVTENSAIIKWATNIRSFSSVLFAEKNDYDPSKEIPYTSERANTQDKVTTHIINLTGLKPNTEYHFMAKSFSLPQVVGKSEDSTFTTKAARVQARVFDVKNSSFRVVWSTDEPASSMVETKNVRTGEMIRKSSEARKTAHEVLVENLVPGATYDVRVFGYNEKGNLIESGDPVRVTTSVDTTPPKISNFKVDNALVPGRTDRIQTIISWVTDEPANSTVYYKEGSGGTDKDFANKVESLDSYVLNHNIIIINLKPGVIYQIKIESTDQSGNKAVFGPRTIITPRQGESIFDVIFKNFEDTFKFLRNVGQ